MSVLDLQGLDLSERERPKGPPPGSHGSKGCGNVGVQSNLSILCDIL